VRTVNMHEAKTHLSRLVEQAAKGEPFVIAKAGKPLVKVVALDAPSAGQVKRIGFMEGQILVPDDFDIMGRAEIARLFGYGSA
jgi:prevent-host-death family protein